MKKDNSNRIRKGMMTALLLLLISPAMQAQQATSGKPAPVLPDTSKMSYNQISQQMKLYIYPTKGQNKQKQKEDEFECYKWAVEQSGIDPLNLPKTQPPPEQKGPTGGLIVGGAKGAAAGAAIGAIAGDAGKGAAIGAVAGGLAGRRQGKMAQQQANEQAKQQAAAQDQALKDSFIKAFAVCIEGKGYTVK